VSTMEIDAPPGDVFAYGVDPTRFAEWQNDVVSVHIVEVTRSRYGRGSRRLATSAATVDRASNHGERRTRKPPEAQGRNRDATGAMTRPRQLEQMGLRSHNESARTSA
jgi:hypothetical protein